MATTNLKMEQAVSHYASMLGLKVDDPQVVKYAQGLAKTVGAEPVREAPAPRATGDRVSLRYIRAVRRYAESQGLDVRDEQVKKYARGLLNIFKDFSERPGAIEELGLLAQADDIDEDNALKAVE